MHYERIYVHASDPVGVVEAFGRWLDDAGIMYGSGRSVTLFAGENWWYFSFYTAADFERALEVVFDFSASAQVRGLYPPSAGNEE